MNRFIFYSIVVFVAIYGKIPLQANGIDSIRTQITQVKCHGFRDGIIHVDTVFGGIPPFYFSLDGSSFSTNPTFDRLQAGSYTLHVRDGSGESGQWELLLKEPMALEVRLEADAVEIAPGERLGLRAIASVEREFLQTVAWMPPDLFNTQDTLRQVVSLTQSTQIEVMVEDKNGCTDMDRVTVEVSAAPLFIPNAIKPGSADSNGFFTVFSGHGIRQIACMQIFSRGGAMIFERRQFPANAPALGWNGWWNNRSAPPGVYPYLIVAELLNGKLIQYRGAVTVVN